MLLDMLELRGVEGMLERYRVRRTGTLSMNGNSRSTQLLNSQTMYVYSSDPVLSPPKLIVSTNRYY